MLFGAGAHLCVRSACISILTDGMASTSPAAFAAEGESHGRVYHIHSGWSCCKQLQRGVRNSPPFWLSQFLWIMALAAEEKESCEEQAAGRCWCAGVTR